MADAIPFSRPSTTGKELTYIAEAIENRHLAGDGLFTKRCNKWLEQTIGCQQALLTHSCTAALEMAALLLNLQPGDEVIMPSFTFVSTANAFVLRGAVPVFVDVRGDTLNMDERLIEAALTKRTRAIVAVHYAGVSCDMDAILEIARRHDLYVVEDAAQGLGSTYRDKPLGSLSHIAALSFHETKNIIAGEGGALLINDPKFVDRAHIIREKGTNRTAFFQGQVDKYTWVDIGSSYLPSEITAAFLWAQLECAREITLERQRIWYNYHSRLESLEHAGVLRRPIVPQHVGGNGHIYYILVNSSQQRASVLAALRAQGVQATFHYIPLHTSPAGERFGRTSGSLDVTNMVSERLVRLPLWDGMSDAEIDRVIECVSGLLAAPGERQELAAAASAN